MATKESERLQEGSHWKKWGSYVSERNWGTVREDYSPDGKAWDYVTHDMARSKAYRWGEDGIAGICDKFQKLVFSIALWNEKDPILKERMFGLNTFEGNHGEDVKEYFFYLDATPTHSYMKYLYKYPHREFPYDQLVQENKRRTALDREYELVDTGIFKDNRYFDVFVEYAKAGPEDICIRIEVFNRGADPARIHVLPQLCYRNTWSWTEDLGKIPEIRAVEGGVFADSTGLPAPERVPSGYDVGSYYLFGAGKPNLLFANNETNNERIWKTKSRTPYVKDAFHRAIIDKENCVNPNQTGTKVGFHYSGMEIPPGQSHVIRLRLTKDAKALVKDVDKIVAARKSEADEFYADITPPELSNDDRMIFRQAIAGMLFGKQFYSYNVKRWFEGDNPKSPPPTSRYDIRNEHWTYLYSYDVISMPDKWEYPWFASWDLAFQAIVLSLADMELAKKQLALLLYHDYQHPNGQIPAYEWSFSDLNPPVQAFAAWTLYEKDGKRDRDFLEFMFLKLTRNFGWWVNKVDNVGNNFFEGGFLGMDNISVFDRSKPLRDGGQIEQSDGTGWMGFFSLYMMRMALELAKEDPVYEAPATIYFEHFAYITAAMHQSGDVIGRKVEMWDEEDAFFYDVVAYPNGDHKMLKIRSFVGIVPFFSIDFYDEKELQSYPGFYERFKVFVRNNKSMLEHCLTSLPQGNKNRYVFSMIKLSNVKRVLKRIFDSNEFLSPYGLRSLSKFHEKNPFVFECGKVGYEPAESMERIKGGNSNWRGPIWFPINYLFLSSLLRLRDAGFEEMNVMGEDLRNRLINLFRKDAQGKRAVHGDYQIFQKDPYWKDLLIFYEHYHGDNGRGLGASHQTGWSGLVANLIAGLFDFR